MTQSSPTPAFLITAKYVLDPADVPAFKAIAAAMAKNAHSRLGCSFLNAAQDLLDPNTFHLTEGWVSQDAANEFLHSESFQYSLKEALALRILDRSGTVFVVASSQQLDMPS